MQRNNRLWIAVVGLSLAATAHAQQAAPAAAASPAKAGAPSGDEIRAVGLGSKAAPSATFKDLISLQEQVQLKEMRDKLNQGGAAGIAAPVSTPIVAPVVPSAPSIVSTAARPSAAARGTPPAPAASTPPVVTAEQRERDERLSSRAMVGGVRWIRSISVGGIARADLNTGNYVRTVREGDQINGWTVGRIQASGVTLERRFGNVNDSFVIPSAVDLTERPASPVAGGMARPPVLPVVPRPDSTALFTPPPLVAR